MDRGPVFSQRMLRLTDPESFKQICWKKKNQQQAPARCISATETALGTEFCLALFSPRLLRGLVDGTIPLCKNKKVTKLCGGFFFSHC